VKCTHDWSFMSFMHPQIHVMIDHCFVGSIAKQAIWSGQKL
jgi:hypothetical protein